MSLPARASGSAASADKILFQTIMDGAGLRTPELTAITQAGRYLPTAPTITDPAVLADKLRDPSVYPLFAKQVAGKYSLSVLSADGFDPDADEVLLLDGTRQDLADVAALLADRPGFLIQRRLAPAAGFGRAVRTAALVCAPAGPGHPERPSDPPRRRQDRNGDQPGGQLLARRAIGSAPSIWHPDASLGWCMAPARTWWSMRRTPTPARPSSARPSQAGAT